MGGKSGGGSVQSAPKNPYQDELARIASTLFSETTPLRQGLTSNFEQLLGIDPRVAQLSQLQSQRGGNNKRRGSRNSIDQITALQQDIAANPFQGENTLFSPVTQDNISSSPLFALLKDANEQQFNLAQQQAMSMLPNGGSLNQAIGTDIPTQRARSMVAGMGGLAENEQNRRNMLLGQALGLASGGATGAMQGFGNAGSLQAQAMSTQAALANAQADRSAGKAQGVGELAGTLGAAAIKKCWVAREVYGIDNPRWVIFFYWKETQAPALFKHSYNIFGRVIAKLIRNNNKIKSVIRSWMDRKIAGYL